MTPTDQRLEDLPNIGPAMARDLRRLGIQHPADLIQTDPYALYDKLSKLTKQRQDPCVLDTFISVVKYMNGAAAKPWWAYTPERKARLSKRTSSKTRT